MINTELFILLLMGLSFHVLIHPKQMTFKDKSDVDNDVTVSGVYGFFNLALLIGFGYSVYQSVAIFVILLISHLIFEDRKLSRHTTLYLHNRSEADIKKIWWTGTVNDLIIHLWVIFIISIIF